MKTRIDISIDFGALWDKITTFFGKEKFDIYSERRKIVDRLKKKNKISETSCFNLLDIWEKLQRLEKYREYAGSTEFDGMLVGESQHVVIQDFINLMPKKKTNIFWHSHPTRWWWREKYLEETVSWLSKTDIGFMVSRKMTQMILISKKGIYLFSVKLKGFNWKKFQKYENDDEISSKDIHKMFGIKRTLLASRKELQRVRVKREY